MTDPRVLLLTAGALLLVALWLCWPDRGLFWRWQRAVQLTERVLIEDALKHIFTYVDQGRQPTLESVAGALNVPGDRAAQLLSEMQTRELVLLQLGALQLTPRGRDYALGIIRAHRLWERYLAERSGYRPVDWHDRSERREHELSLAEVNLLAAELGHPQYDPHGDPIPTSGGDIRLPADRLVLTELPADEPAQIVHLEDEPQTVYAQLLAEGLHLGMQVIVTERNGTRIRFWGDGDDHVLAPLLAQNVTVAPIQRDELRDQKGQPLSTLLPGQSGTVLRISPQLRGAARRRLFDLGVLPGTTIAAELISPSGDPTAYRIRGALIGFRKEQADMIRISPTSELPQSEVDMEISA